MHNFQISLSVLDFRFFVVFDFKNLFLLACCFFSVLVPGSVIFGFLAVHLFTSKFAPWELVLWASHVFYVCLYVFHRIVMFVDSFCVLLWKWYIFMLCYWFVMKMSCFYVVFMFFIKLSCCLICFCVFYEIAMCFMFV